MSKNLSTKKNKPLNIVKKATLILLAIVGFYILALVVNGLVISPILDRVDESKYAKLETSMDELYQEILAVSDGDEWNYEKYCDSYRSGPWPTGKYTCVIDMMTEKEVTSVDQVNEMHDRYYSVVDGSELLSATSELNSKLNESFVVGGAEKEYKDVVSGLECNYSAELQQKDFKGGDRSNLYGSDISGDSGVVRIEMICINVGIARGNWYGDNN